MSSKCHFSFSHYREIILEAQRLGYRAITVGDYFSATEPVGDKLLVNRVDVDLDISKAAVLGEIFTELGVQASFFLRLHADEYNLFSFDSYRIAKNLAAAGFELGLHSEIIDLRELCGEDPALTLPKEIALFEDFFNVKVRGVASHGGLTGFNNLDFWHDHHPNEFGLLYEAYDPRLWEHSRYVSDSEFTRWKAYDNGVLRNGDRRCACEHFADGVPIIYLLTHPCSYS